MTVYNVHWDDNDARFFYYDNMIVSSFEEWKQKVFEKVIEHKASLMDIYTCDVDSNEVTFENWVKKCIDNDCYCDECIIDNYKN